MKSRYVIWMLCLLLLLPIVLPMSISASQITDIEDEFPCTITNVSKTELPQHILYSARNIKLMDESQAKKEGIPSGYQGKVYSVERTEENGVGVLVDFSDQKIPLAVLSSITFRVYVGDDGIASDNYPEVRIVKPHSGGNWAMRYIASTQTDQWIDIVLSADGGNFLASSGFEDLCEDGYLSKFNLCVRSNATGNYAFYIDSITLQFKKDYGVAPELSYEGENTIYVPAGSAVRLMGSAYDALEKRNVPLFIKWPEGTELDGQGTPVQLGTYQAKVCAADFYGNTAEHPVTVVVEEPDRIAPVISIDTDKMYATVGTIPLLLPEATDDHTVGEVTMEWSVGALDNRGRLVEGVHTFTVTAYDSSLNRTQKVITVYVSDEEVLGDNVIDEAILRNECQHIWDNGVVTKESNCKEKGITTYTCTGCSATYTEDIEPNENHKYNNQDGVCSVCGAEEPKSDFVWIIVGVAVAVTAITCVFVIVLKKKE